MYSGTPLFRKQIYLTAGEWHIVTDESVRYTCRGNVDFGAVMTDFAVSSGWSGTSTYLE